MSFVVRNFQKYFLSEKPITPPGIASVSDLNLSFDVKQSFQKLKNYEFTKTEILHYGFLSLVIVFAFVIAPAPFVLKFLAACLFVLILSVPLTSQFFLNALPILAWLALFFVTGKIPADVRPPISVQTLPAIETIFYGDNLSDVLATYTASVLDILAWVPYGLIHFAFPFVLAGLLFLFGPPTCLRAYAFAFGYMNLFGVLVQIMFPAAPPWYKIINGLSPANYSMGGSPGGLARIDTLLGVDMYTSTFTNAPVPFGAFPSLHSGCATMETMFLSYLFPKFAIVWWGYTMWLWWCTMYLTHHYFIDLIAGACLTFMVYTYTKYNHLPVLDTNKFCRWSYAEITKPDIHLIDPLSSNTYEHLNSNMDDLENNYVTRDNPNEEFEMSSLVSRSSVSSSRLSLNLASPRSMNARNSANINGPPILNTTFDVDAMGSSAPPSAISSIYDPAQTNGGSPSVLSFGTLGTSPATSVFDSTAHGSRGRGDDDNVSITSSKTSIDLNFDRAHAQNLFKSPGKRD
ncbi:inositol phosphorylceramide synthase [Saccharomycopsis crataegensis]|uniref:Inositol phosphorylceramide synthase n=1 Tax=Saccharomycopsis crataegensis TaxID=43959 RepID=A0AAV5QHV1_9ASCO|nr:inositol phosphorylceramide synthase [Saccharomycopsis crataegensis]